ncbi:hypothetical protein GOP47_0001010 [Adiantum capillus-veneris]|uniref:Uncharacterized protein n=1 Tax=Adiantum capillus-veneris TaxID=13818 RepID=A0A9D4VE20_ADICA|nr:hypothetical protein GOP47_0001010 [Adiantum capillus-veneris]
MSRCYPYPPPGYVKKANVELALSAKKEKHKHKDKKKKRQKDNETNGDLPRDPDKRSKKSHQVGVVINEDRSLANGSLLETKVASSDALHKKTSQKLPAGSSNAEVLSAGVLARNGKGHEISSKQKHELPLVSLNAACETNGAVTCEATSSSVSELKFRGEDIHNQYIPCVGKNWSALDDQGWLFHQSDHWSGAVPRQKVDESNSSQVWAEAMLLPSVGIYALPYVVPD